LFDYNEYGSIIRDVFSNKNIMAIALTTSLWSLVRNAWSPFWAPYLKNELGASVTIIGFLSMIQTAERLIFQLPGGYLADKYGRKKIIIWGTALRTISPTIYFFAPNWRWIVPAVIFNGMTSLYMPAFTAIIADSLPEESRGTGYGAYNMITSIPNIISPAIGGYVMDFYGYRLGLRIFLVFQIIVSGLMTLIRWKILKETIEVEKGETKKPSLGSVTNFPRSIKIMIIVAIIGSFSGRIVMDFTSLYALEVIKLTNTQYGIITTVIGAISSILALPGGVLSDKYGRKPAIMLSRTVTPISQYLVTLTQSFTPYFAVRIINSTGLALGGGGMYAGGPSWNALIADIVPPERRATVIGTIGTLTGIVAAPSSIIGGWLWEQYSPQLPFRLSAIVGLASASIF
jgi:MFS transporter, DHA1 family, multidrug resistance protein